MCSLLLGPVGFCDGLCLFKLCALFSCFSYVFWVSWCLFLELFWSYSFVSFILCLLSLVLVPGSLAHIENFYDDICDSFAAIWSSFVFCGNPKLPCSLIRGSFGLSHLFLLFSDLCLLYLHQILWHINHFLLMISRALLRLFRALLWKPKTLLFCCIDFFWSLSWSSLGFCLSSLIFVLGAKDS